MSAYAALNPFVSTSVGENDLWNSAAFLDVPYIHSVSFGALKIAVDQVRMQRRSQVRFVRGAGGSGKSHLFARLRRECADKIFYAYAPNPPLQPEALENFILTRLVSSLRHPARTTDGQETAYSQLRLLAYALLKPVIEQDITLPELHESWAEIGLETRKELIHQAVQLLEAEHPMVPRSVLRCLLNVLRDDKEHLAAQWLSGAAYLTENELKYLNVPEPLARSEMGLVIQLFGKLAAQASSPVVLVLDQLDLIITPPQFDEVQRLLFTLIDQSENWVVLIGLVAERFAAWDASLSQALRGRIGVPDSNAPLGFRLPVVDMLPIANEQKRLLLTCRLETPELMQQRKKDGITSAMHPLLEEDIARLTAGGAIFPRHLLAAAAEVYTMRTMETSQVHLPPEVVAVVATTVEPPAVVAPPVYHPPAAETAPVPVRVVEEIKEAPAAATVLPVPMPAPQPVPPPAINKTPLAEKIDALLQQAIDASKAETIPPSAIDLGERARDLIELMVAPPVTITEGDIRKTYDNFDGADRWFEWGGGKVRIVTSDSMRSSFIAVLERIKEADGDTLLLRNDVAPVSGQLTMELLNTFKAKNLFHHLPASEAAVLAALGRILASQREGSYDQLATEPPATKANVLAALRNHPLLRGVRLWDMIQKVHAPKEPPQVQSSVLSSIIRPSAAPVAKPSPVPGAKPPPPPSSIPQGKPVARPPSVPIIKPVARPTGAPVAKPPQGMLRPPMSKLPPPSQGTAA
ncbi:MAG: hypothetical protein ACKVY0_29745 [Prosthecobacter sp.]|uniref:hypothetical protein n=1 Tax=Prosthecobacter sp. TaxID=1965333 RepID=UPI0039029FDE